MQREAIMALIPHQGASCLLAQVIGWDAAAIRCTAVSHLDPANPLRAGGRLGIVAGVEYGLQAAALHGALRGGGVAQRSGYLAALRDLHLGVARLDDPAHGALRIEARLLEQTAAGFLYALALHDASGAWLLRGQATVALPG
jgi:predicted hotdog family 3-hydroxylacyl-ACP dehydratase